VTATPTAGWLQISDNPVSSIRVRTGVVFLLTPRLWDIKVKK